MSYAIAHLLLDTHIAVRHASEPQRLSREQRRVLEAAEARGEPFAVSAISLVEIALLAEGGRLKGAPLDLLAMLRAPGFTILPITPDIARELTYFPALKDPFDRIIVATARVHRLRLVTSDQRIIHSKSVYTLE